MYKCLNVQNICSVSKIINTAMCEALIEQIILFADESDSLREEIDSGDFEELLRSNINKANELSNILNHYKLQIAEGIENAQQFCLPNTSPDEMFCLIEQAASFVQNQKSINLPDVKTEQTIALALYITKEDTTEMNNALYIDFIDTLSDVKSILEDYCKDTNLQLSKTQIGYAVDYVKQLAHELKQVDQKSGVPIAEECQYLRSAFATLINPSKIAVCSLQRYTLDDVQNWLSDCKDTTVEEERE